MHLNEKPPFFQRLFIPIMVLPELSFIQALHAACQRSRFDQSLAVGVGVRSHGKRTKCIRIKKHRVNVAVKAPLMPLVYPAPSPSLIACAASPPASDRKAHPSRLGTLSLFASHFASTNSAVVNRIVARVVALLRNWHRWQDMLHRKSESLSMSIVTVLVLWSSFGCLTV